VLTIPGETAREAWVALLKPCVDLGQPLPFDVVEHGHLPQGSAYPYGIPCSPDRHHRPESVKSAYPEPRYRTAASGYSVTRRVYLKDTDTIRWSYTGLAWGGTG
jgi:hypothetical protein